VPSFKTSFFPRAAVPGSTLLGEVWPFLGWLVICDRLAIAKIVAAIARIAMDLRTLIIRLQSFDAFCWRSFAQLRA
jgi:hypothetical protein